MKKSGRAFTDIENSQKKYIYTEFPTWAPETPNPLFFLVVAFSRASKRRVRAHSGASLLVPKKHFYTPVSKRKEKLWEIRFFSFFLIGLVFWRRHFVRAARTPLFDGKRRLAAFPARMAVALAKKKNPPKGLTRPQQERPTAPGPQGPRAPGPARTGSGQKKKNTRNIRPLVVANQKLAL